MLSETRNGCFTIGKIFAATWKLLDGATYLRFVSTRGAGANIGLPRLPILFARPVGTSPLWHICSLIETKAPRISPCAPFCLFMVHPRGLRSSVERTTETSRPRERETSLDFTFTWMFSCRVRIPPLCDIYIHTYIYCFSNSFFSFFSFLCKVQRECFFFTAATKSLVEDFSRFFILCLYLFSRFVRRFVSAIISLDYFIQAERFNV